MLKGLLKHYKRLKGEIRKEIARALFGEEIRVRLDVLRIIQALFLTDDVAIITTNWDPTIERFAHETMNLRALFAMDVATPSIRPVPGRNQTRLTGSPGSR